LAPFRPPETERTDSLDESEDIVSFETFVMVFARLRPIHRSKAR
jgi:hypothetical protein